MPVPDLVQAGETVHVRHAHVEEDEVGIGASHERKDLGPGLRLAHDLEVAVRLERPADPVQDEAMVVGDHDPHWRSVAQAEDAARRWFADPSIEA